MIDVERPAIPLAKSANETLVVVEENGIVVVGKNPVRFFDAADSFIQQPLRSPGLIFRDNPDGERLPFGLRLGLVGRGAASRLLLAASSSCSMWATLSCTPSTS